MSRNFYHRGLRFILANRGISSLHSSSYLGFYSIHLASIVRSYSAESVQSDSTSIDFETLNRPDSALSLLKNDYGFTISHLSLLAKKAPKLLSSDPSKTLLPKLQFLSSIGVPSSDLPQIVCFNPNLLTWSLNGKLIPNYNLLKTVLQSEKLVIQSLKSCYFVNCLHKHTPINIALLRKLKVSQKHISFLLINSPEVLCCDGVKFNENVNKVIEMGIGPNEKVFVRALQVLFKIKLGAWEEKVEVYRSWGLSEEGILSAFRKHPYCMGRSVEKITGTLDFILNKMKMGYRAADVFFCPSIFDYSLEKRIIPRLLVIRALQLKGLVKANIPLSTVITTSEKLFMSNYVIKFEDEVPQILSVYQGKTSIRELGFDDDAEKKKHVGV